MPHGLRPVGGWVRVETPSLTLQVRKDGGKGTFAFSWGEVSLLLRKYGDFLKTAT